MGVAIWDDRGCCFDLYGRNRSQEPQEPVQKPVESPKGPPEDSDTVQEPEGRTGHQPDARTD
jgi:hypothetical protein